MTLAVHKRSKELFNFRIASLDADLLKEKNSRRRVLKTLSNLHDYNLNYYILVKNEDEKKFASKFINNNKLSAKIIKIDSTYDRPKKLVSLITNKSKPKLDEKISAGKKILHLGSRKSNFIDTFKPPKGVVCHKFYKVVWGTQCPYDCSYCFLQLTYRIFPYVQQYLNLEDLFREMEKLNEKVDKPVILNSGELSDSLALDSITGIATEVIEKASELENIKLVLLTKGDKVDHLPEVPSNKVIISASLNTPFNAEIFEKDTANPYDRIKSLEVLHEKGYEVRCRIDPIITYNEDWEEEYEKLINRLFKNIEPDVITLGQPRFYSALLNIVKKRQPKAGNYFDSDAVPSVGKRKRPDHEHRLSTYKKIVNMIREQGDYKIALCKEDPKILKQLGIKQKICNCI